MLALSALAWLETVALMTAGGAASANIAAGSGAAMTGMAMSGATGSSVSAGGSTLAAWSLMVAAMMLPLTIGPLRTTATRSLWRRRQRAIVEFLAAFVGVWALVGGALLAIDALAVELGWTDAHGAPLALAAGLALASAWQLTPWKRRALRACHRSLPLAPRGWRAVRDCLRYGASTARSCLASCGIAMAALALGGASLATMLVVTAVVIAECYATRPRPIASAAVLAVLAGATLLL